MAAALCSLWRMFREHPSLPYPEGTALTLPRHGALENQGCLAGNETIVEVGCSPTFWLHAPGKLSF